MPKLSVTVIGSKNSDDSETILSHQTSDAYSPDILDELVSKSINKLSSLALQDCKDIQVTASLTADDSEVIRPSLCLSKETIKKLSDIRASFDFDPYI